MAAPPMDAHRLVDSLTAHISLYSSTSTSTTATATTAPRAAVLRWFAALAPPHRQAALTVADPAFLQIVLQMQSRLRGSGHGFFLLLPDIPTPAALPSLLFRRSRGLLARASAANEPERLLARSLRLFSSSDGGDGGFRGFRCSADGLDACTVADELVRDVDRFVAAMDGVSGGRFLRGEEKGLGEDWFEFAWLKEKGYYSLEAFVANKLELALRLSWMNATGGKRRGGVGGKAKEGIAGVSANVFWRKKGCLDWWDRMEPHLKEKVLRVVFGKSAKTLAFEVGKVVKDAAEDGTGFFSRGRESSVRYGPIMSWKKDNIDFYPGTVHNGKLTSVTNCILSLMILHEMSIAITDTLHVKNGEELLFSSLSSVYTFSDCVMRGLRALLGAISSDHVKVELLGEETYKVPPKKSKTKVKNKECGKKRISAAEKPLNYEKPFKEDASGIENKGSCVLNSDDVHVDCGVERITKSADNKGDKCTKTLSTDFAKESINGNADCEVHHTVKKSRKKSNKRKKSRFKEATDDNESRKRMENTSSAATCHVDELHGISISTCGVIDNVDHDPSVDSPDINDVGENRTDDGSCISMNVEGELECASVPIIDTAEVEKVVHKSDMDAPEGSTAKEPIVAQDLNTLVYGKEATGYFPRGLTSTVGGLSYEWPSWRPVYYPSVYSPHLPPATDRLHLDVGHNWHSQLNQSFFAPRHQTRNALVDSGWGQILPSGLDSTDDWDSHWTVDEEAEFHTYSSRDYNQYFGGGIMYWNPADHGSTGFSRPPSLSSEDSSWAWHEAELSRVVDDMVGLSASYGANSLTSPTAAPFCSPFDPVGPTQQPVGFVVSGNDALAKDATVEDKASGTLNNTPGGFVEGLAADSLPYPILRPLIVPNLSKKESGSEYKLTHDRKSPCLPPTRRETPRIKRPPSPVIRCIPQGPRPPPPSPMSDSRKHRGFPAVRSGSSSPRNWGVRNWYHDGITNDEDLICANSTDVIWPSWRGKGVGPYKMAQSLPSSLLQDRLLAISQVDHDHPDLSLPLQPPNIQTSPPYKACMLAMHDILHEEIDSFCKQVGDANLIKKPYVNWAVKRVARSLQVLWPRSRTTIFGSNATGLALPTSDVDLVVCLPPVRNLEPIKEAGILEGRNGIKETCLQHAARYLGNQEWVKSESLKTVENTAIPVIMLVAEVPHDYVNANGSSPTESAKNDIEGMVKDEGNLGNFGLSEHETSLWQLDSTMKNKGGTDVRLVRIDISFKSPAHTGLRTTDLVRELIEQFPAAAPLALVVKQFLADRSLDHSYSGGLSSYCLVLLIIRFLQHEHHVGCSTKNLGSLLMDFLYFFGNVFDPRQMRISIQGTGVYVNRERGHSIDPLHIDDPLCPMNNVGRNCFRIHQCVKAFADAYTVLVNELSHLSPSDDDPIEKYPVKLLPKIIPSINHVSKI